MAAVRSWRRAHQVRSKMDRVRDAERCCVVDASGVRCPNRTVDLGYCAAHWGR